MCINIKYKDKGNKKKFILWMIASLYFLNINISIFHILYQELLMIFKHLVKIMLVPKWKKIKMAILD
jgi:hypothetical protein